MKAERISEIKSKALRISIAMLIAAGTGALALPASVNACDQASACGDIHAARANENGPFGWLGDKGGTPGYHNAVGQEPGATGYNNSHVDCNPRNNF